MGEVGSKAQLIDASDLDARSHKIAATVPREEIQEALRVEDGQELILDIARRENGDVQAHTLRVAWTEDQLEELLRETSGEQVTLVFDADELQQALVADVEAHGAREKTAAVLTVAAMAAGVAASAQPASARLDPTTGGTVPPIEMVSDAASSGPASVEAATGPELISDAALSGPVSAETASGPELISDAALSGPVSAETASGPELISDAASSGPAPIEATATGPELISDAASSGPVSAAQSTSLAGTASSASDTGLSAAEIAGTAVGGGLVLLITAAGFAVRGRRRAERLA
ncbi:MAG TPA: hypothetical protein VGJ23_05610 [Gaiellaceae bacterium]|jgi:hypothetical protein